MLDAIKKPAVFVHRLFGTQIQNSVVPDDQYGAGLAVDHLVRLGHRAIAYINGPASWHPARERLEGFKQRLAQNGLPLVEEWLQPGDWEIEGGYKAAQFLLQLDNRPTAIFAANDLMALGAIYAIQDASLSVPEDMAIVGYDNRDFTWIVRPRITTVVMPVYEMGKIAAEMLLKKISGEISDVDEVKIKGELIVRDTCGADESLKTRENADHVTSPRRILLHRQPEN